MRKRKFWGWGYEDELLSDEEENNIDKRIASTFNLDSVDRIEIPDIKSIDPIIKNKIAVSNKNGAIN